MTTALITGASSGMGKATALQLIADGYTVYGAARRIDQMGDLAERGGIPVRMDISKDQEITATIDQISREQGGVDILINNAGFGLYGAMEDTSLEDARYQFEVNLFGLARLTQLVLPYMREQQSGKIVNMSSMGGKIYTPLGSWYHASKHAVEGWSDCLRLELEQFGIDVIIIEPGIIHTEFDKVMTGPMMKRSGETAYRELAQKVAEATRTTYTEKNSSPPTVVSEAISSSLKKKTPGTRYAVGKRARSLIAMRKWMTDRMFDKAVMRSF